MIMYERQIQLYTGSTALHRPVAPQASTSPTVARLSLGVFPVCLKSETSENSGHWHGAWLEVPQLWKVSHLKISDNSGRQVVLTDSVLCS